MNIYIYIKEDYLGGRREISSGREYDRNTLRDI
jgi:hypothetical protein